MDSTELQGGVKIEETGALDLATLPCQRPGCHFWRLTAHLATAIQRTLHAGCAQQQGHQAGEEQAAGHGGRGSCAAEVVKVPCRLPCACSCSGG